MTLSRLSRPVCLIVLFMSSALPVSIVQAAHQDVRQIAADTPTAAARAAVIGLYDPKFSMYTCSTQLPAHRIAAWSTCPFTERFKRRLAEPGHANRGVELCGNQFPPRTVRLRVLSRSTATARVNAYWDLGGRRSYASTFLIIHRGTTWLIDDEYLLGQPSHDIYREGAVSFCR